jgi:hypothetical protein
MMRSKGHVACIKLKNYNILVIKPKEMKLPGIIRNTWKYNTKTYFTGSVIWNKFKRHQRAWKKGLLVDIVLNSGVP